MTEKELQALQIIHWEYIPENTVKAFFENRPKVLLSSLTGNLKSFYERYKSMINITVYSSAATEAYLAGDYDILIYEADLWENSRCAKINVSNLYVRLIREECTL